MKAIVQDRYGDETMLLFEDVPTPPLLDGTVLVRVEAAGVDPSVWHLMTGTPYIVRVMGFGLTRPKQRVRGLDFSGVVEAVGAGVSGFEPGDEVLGTATGTFAEYVVAKADKVVHKPASLSFEEAAAVPVSSITALQAVRDKAEVEAGQRVLVLGAGGGVGSFAVQIAKAAGAHVTGVCSTTKVELVRSLGADEVVDYTQGEPTGTYDVVIDTGGNRPLRVVRRLLTPRGTFVFVGAEGGGAWLGPVSRLLGAAVQSMTTRQRLVGMYADENAADLAAVCDLIEQGKVRPVVDRTYPLASAADAVRDLAAGLVRGKAVLTVH